MKHLFTFFALLSISVIVKAGDFSDYRGVWASDIAEAVVCDNACIFFENTPKGMKAYLDVPSYNIHSSTAFADSLFVTEETKPLKLTLVGDTLVIGDKKMIKVEEINVCPPYERKQAISIHDVGDCLQEWRLGAAYGRENKSTFCEINTNRHMFVYVTNPYMTYIRAAAARNNNKGTLFFQNIRMMSNNNTGELTSSMKPENLSIAKNDLEIDNNQFKANSCTFSPGGGIYWSLISFSPDEILLNGCGETYKVVRHASKQTKDEYFKFEKYSSETEDSPGIAPFYD